MMDDFILINSLERVDHLYSFVYHSIRELGVKLPKAKKINKLNQSSRKSTSITGQQQQDETCTGKIFGESLNNIPKIFLQNYGFVPEFLVKASEIIEQHLHCEGLFRKSGSVSRQKELRLAVDEGKSLNGANVFDTAVLIKQFFRELPEPLFLTVYLDAFVRCYQLPPDKDPKRALLQLCLLLPLENIGALRYTMHLLFKVSSVSDKNKMTANNLALVMAPNMMHCNKGTQKMSSSEEKLLHVQTCILELLIKNWEHIGMVSVSLQQQRFDMSGISFKSSDSRVSLMSECFGTDDELDASDDNTLEDSKEISQKKRRKRSSSLTGFVSSIAQGLAKLRRSTDGKGVNMSLNSTQKAELSVASCNYADQMQEVLSNTVTPCVMRKRKASGDTVPFSASKKKAILGNLPQRSALASTPFTPASTVKKNQDTSTLNVTTPAPSVAGKTARKKLSLFTSPGKVKRESSESPPGLRSKSGKRKKNIFKRLSSSRSEKVTDESDSLPRSVSSPTLHEGTCQQDVHLGSHDVSREQHLTGKNKLKKKLISEPSPVIVPVCVRALDIQQHNEPRRSRRDEFEHERHRLIKNIKESVDPASGSMSTDMQSHSTPDLIEPILPPPPGFGDQTIVNVEDEENEEVDVGSDMESEAGFSTISGGTVLHRTECGVYTKHAPHTLSGSSLLSSVSQRMTFSLHSLDSLQSTDREASCSQSSLSSTSSDSCCPSSNVPGLQYDRKSTGEEEEVWVRRKSTSTPEALDTLDSSSRNSLIVTMREGSSSINRHTGVPRKKSISAEDLQSARKKVNVPARAQSLYLSPCKKYNFKPHLEISKQTHNLLARAGYIQPSDSDANDLPVPVKSPKRSSYREEMMLSLRSSFHERHTHNNVSFRSLRTLPDSSFASDRDRIKNFGQKECKNLGTDHIQVSVADKENILGRRISDPELESSMVDTDLSDVQNKDETENDLNMTGLDETVVEVDVTSTADDTVNDDTAIDMDVTNTAADNTAVGIDVTSVESCSINGSTLMPAVDFDNKDSESMEMDCTETEPEVESQVPPGETSEAPSPKLSLKNTKPALTLSGILDQEIVHQVKIKRAEVVVQRHDSVLNVQHAGLVSQSIRQFTQEQPNSKDRRVRHGPVVSKRGTSPVRIPTIFAKNQRRAQRYRELVEVTRERTGNQTLVDTFSEEKSEDLAGREAHSVIETDLNFSETGAVGVSPPGTPEKRIQIDLSESLMETINDICTPRADRLKPAESGPEMKSPLKESTNQIQSALVANLKSGNVNDSVKFHAAVKTPHRIPLPNDLKPLQMPSSARSQRPQIKRLRVQYSPRKINHRSPKMNSPYRSSPKTPVTKHH